MPPSCRVAVIGECMVELKKVSGNLEQGFGGDTLNTAVYLSRLTKANGVVTSYVTGLGRDPFSLAMLNAWKGEALNTDMVYLSEDKLPGIYAIETSDDGERSFFYWRNDSAAKYWMHGLEPSQLASELSKHQTLYLSGISLAILPKEYRQKLIDALTICRKNGSKVVFDNNYRPTLWGDRAEAQQCYSRILTITDIALLTYDDEVMLWGDETEKQTIARSQQFGVTEIVVKRGPEACLVVTDKGLQAVAANLVENVVDTTAAGDSFSAGYLAKRLSGGDPIQAAKAGHALAGSVIQFRGAIIPRDAMPTI